VSKWFAGPRLVRTVVVDGNKFDFSIEDETMITVRDPAEPLAEGDYDLKEIQPVRVYFLECRSLLNARNEEIGIRCYAAASNLSWAGVWRGRGLPQGRLEVGDRYTMVGYRLSYCEQTFDTWFTNFLTLARWTQFKCGNGEFTELRDLPGSVESRLRSMRRIFEKELRRYGFSAGLITFLTSELMQSAARVRADSTINLGTPRRPSRMWASDSRRGETILAFIQDVYGRYLRAGVMVQADLLSLDFAAYKAFKSYCRTRQLDDRTIIPSNRRRRQRR
jgi:hypothetical protein